MTNLEFCADIQSRIRTGNCCLGDLARVLYQGRDPTVREAYEGVVSSSKNLYGAIVMQMLAASVRTEENVKESEQGLNIHMPRYWDIKYWNQCFIVGHIAMIPMLNSSRWGS
jgi:hypothetical protein